MIESPGPPLGLTVPGRDLTDHIVACGVQQHGTSVATERASSAVRAKYRALRRQWTATPSVARPPYLLQGAALRACDPASIGERFPAGKCFPEAVRRRGSILGTKAHAGYQPYSAPAEYGLVLPPQLALQWRHRRALRQRRLRSLRALPTRTTPRRSRVRATRPAMGHPPLARTAPRRLQVYTAPCRAI